MDARRSSPAAESADRPFVISRTFDAPRRLVFEMWTQPGHLKRWFSPKGFTVLAAKMDFRPGGVYHYGMRAPDGKDMWGRWVFREIAAPERIVFVNSFSDENGGLARPPFPEAWPMEMLSTIDFTESGGRTTVTVTWSPHNSTEAERRTFDAGRSSMQQGWTGTLGQLAAYLASAMQVSTNGTAKETRLVGDREIAATRIFDAPRELVWRVWTEQEHLARWWGPKGFTTTTYSMEVKPGGVWRFVMHGPDGRDYQNKITYLEVVKPERLVYKHGGEKEVEPVNFQVSVTFAERAGKTRVDMRMVFPSANARDYVIKTYGAFEGLKETLGRLEEYLAKGVSS